MSYLGIYLSLFFFSKREAVSEINATRELHCCLLFFFGRTLPHAQTLLPGVYH